MKKLCIFLIEFYQKHISKIVSSTGTHCKYYPTCSEYAKQAFEKYNFLKALFLSVKRLIRCNPFSKGGYDPLK